MMTKNITISLKYPAITVCIYHQIMDELKIMDETTVSQYEDKHTLDYYKPRDIISSYIYFYRPSNGHVKFIIILLCLRKPNYISSLDHLFKKKYLEWI